MFERLALAFGRHFDSDYYDAGLAAAESYQEPRSQEKTDDELAFLARYLRQPWEWLEEQPRDRIERMLRAAVRLLQLENGTRSALDPAAASEENR